MNLQTVGLYAAIGGVCILGGIGVYYAASQLITAAAPYLTLETLSLTVKRSLPVPYLGWALSVVWSGK